jgi:hypothetical protein
MQKLKEKFFAPAMYSLGWPDSDKIKPKTLMKNSLIHQCGLLAGGSSVKSIFV